AVNSIEPPLTWQGHRNIWYYHPNHRVRAANAKPPPIPPTIPITQPFLSRRLSVFHLSLSPMFALTNAAPLVVRRAHAIRVAATALASVLSVPSMNPRSFRYSKAA